MSRHVAFGDREVAFIDPSIQDLDAFLSGLRANVEAHVMGSAENPLVQIAHALEQRGRTAAVHIVAHGEPGELHFAAGIVTGATLVQHAFSLATIGSALRGGDILLWSCETGAGAIGEAFIRELSDATGARVSASTSRVGAASQGGAWKLDVHAITPPLTREGIQAYAGVLGNRRCDRRGWHQ